MGRMAYMDEPELPEWLITEQALTWLATDDAALARACYPDGTSASLDLSGRSPEALSLIERARLETGEGIGTARRAYAGVPWDWRGMSWLDWVRLVGGTSLEAEIILLVRSAL